MLKKGIFLLSFFMILPLSASAQTETAEQGYQRAGILDGIRIQNKFDKLEKPAFMKVYEDYRRDLEIIKKTGRAPDNEALYNDLRQMNSNREIIVSRNKPQKHKQIYLGF